ncbi:hypothetical protein BGW36DRAFT_388035 [Talaromyces proteolyticus]|uniref:FAD-binding domain-containing protein n=1 Tax=Talaromyces proteolyticus TaxID=1131652 RepID=A0AAD4KGC8_9EURO|nr:uncharacterized protein BGW36DRAFT_388035 [Talaromyces proteolyticus]KAH8691286.1 hypothetical protein BGW36DRAFT_388035 [Talaromyces proteolyticus]
MATEQEKRGSDYFQRRKLKPQASLRSSTNEEDGGGLLIGRPIRNCETADSAMALKVIIVGAGLAGSLLANGLLNNDIDFVLYESDEQSSNREGYQIRLGSPALAGFNACLPPEDKDALIAKFGRSGGMISSAPILYNTRFKVLLDLTKFPAYTKSAPINRVILRDFFRKGLDVAEKIQYGKQFKEYRVIPSEDGLSKVEVLFEDGSLDVCDLLISAEGSRSRVNHQIGLDNIVQLTDKWRFLAKGPLSTEKLKSLPPEIKKGPITVLKDGLILFFSAYLPAPKNSTPPGNPDEQGGKEHETISDGASLFWSLSVPSERVQKAGDAAFQDRLAFCIEQLKDWDSGFHEMLKATDDTYIHVFQARASEMPKKTWRVDQRAASKGNPAVGHSHVWLIGDAIHPMLPSRGMGGNQAMRDTADALPIILQLAKKSAHSGLSDVDFEKAVLDYESLMMSRAFGWVKASGGTSGEMVEPESIKGKILLLFAAGVLHIVHVFFLIRTAFGYRPKDDAPELLD